MNEKFARDNNIDIETLNIILKHMETLPKSKCLIKYLRGTANVADVKYLIYDTFPEFMYYIDGNCSYNGEFNASESIIIDIAIDITMRPYYDPKVGELLADKYGLNKYMMEYLYHKVFGDDIFKIMEALRG